jgi:hypothetical protein
MGNEETGGIWGRNGHAHALKSCPPNISLLKGKQTKTNISLKKIGFYIKENKKHISEFLQKNDSTQENIEQSFLMKYF